MTFYTSTRSPDVRVPFMDTVLAGTAPGGGLYIPTEYPRLDIDDIVDNYTTWREVAYAVLQPLMNDIPPEDLRALIDMTFTEEVFGSDDITPLVKCKEDVYVLELSNGPTMAFKDVALQFLGNLMNYVLEKRNTYTHVVGATSGDTGSAAIHALVGKQRISVTMLSPQGRMSDVQRAQMYSVLDDRVHNIAVDGTFDDCQALVKQLFADHEFAARHNLSSVNSINWARIAAQTVYYVWATAELMRIDAPRPYVFSVPTGNFGDVFAGYVARQMGCSIQLIVATNENDVLHEFFTTGVYRPRAGKAKVTTSPSMDILAASNFERIVCDWLSRDSGVMQELWTVPLSHGEPFVVRDLDEVRAYMTSARATMADVEKTIWVVDRWLGYYIDPHTAIAMHAVLEDRVRRDNADEVLGTHVVLETALSDKFPETMTKALGYPYLVSDEVKKLLLKEQCCTEMPNDLGALKAHVVELADRARHM